jgi:hypothetical protein
MDTERLGTAQIIFLRHLHVISRLDDDDVDGV